MDYRARKMTSGFLILKKFRIFFASLAALLAILALLVGLSLAISQGSITPIIYGVLAAVFFLVVAAAVWMMFEHFMQSATSTMTKQFGAPLDPDLANGEEQVGGIVHTPQSIPAGTSFDIQARMTVLLAGKEQDWGLSAANLFTKEDLRGNIDVIVSGETEGEIESLIMTISKEMKLRLPGQNTPLTCLAYGEHEEGESFAIVFVYSISDLIESFEFDRPRLESWYDEFVEKMPKIMVLWSESKRCEIPCHVAD